MAFSRFWQNFQLSSNDPPWGCTEAGLRLPQGFPLGCPEFATKLPWTCPEVAQVCLEVTPELIRGCLRLLEVAQRLPKGCSKVTLRLHRGCSKVGPLISWGCTIPKLPKGYFKVSREFDPKRKLQHKLMTLSAAAGSLKILISIGIWNMVGLQIKTTPNFFTYLI